MATDTGTAEVAIAAVQQLIGTARWRLTLDQFCERLDAPRDDYWKEKFIQWAALAEAFSKFDAHTLALLCTPDERAFIRPQRRCGVCGGMDGEHDWEVHTAEVHAHWSEDL